MVFQDYIEAYLDGALDDETLQAFEDALAADADLREEVEQSREMRARLEGLRLRRLVQANQTSGPGGWIGHFRWYLLLLLFCMGTGVAWWVAFSAPGSDGGEEPAPAPRASPQFPGWRSLQDTASAYLPIAEGEQLPEQEAASGLREKPPLAFQRREAEQAYRAAVAQLEVPDFVVMGEAEKVSDWSGRLSEAKRWLEADRPQLAKEMLAGRVAAAPEHYRDAAEWMIALASWGADPLSGGGELERIAADPGHSFQVAALRLIRVNR